MSKNSINIVIPMAGMGQSFLRAGYTLPKPLVDVNGKPMIERVIENLTPKHPHTFYFVMKQEQYEKYPFVEIFQKTTSGNFEVILVPNVPQGALCTVLTAIDFINNKNELLVANADQIIDVSINDFIDFAQNSNAQAAIMTFEASHPKWSFLRLNNHNEVIETAEKQMISSHATSGIYYYKHGSLFVDAGLSMIEKDIRFNNEFYVCPSFNELILKNNKVIAWEMRRDAMHSLGTAVDLAMYLHLTDKRYNSSCEDNRPNGRSRVTLSKSQRSKPRIPKTQATH